MTQVVLNWHEVATAAREGVQRSIRSLRLARDDRLVSNRGRWENDIQAACAERAVAKGLGIYWPEGGALDYAGDLPGGLHVRYTEHPHGHLLIYETDPDDGRFVLVTGDVPVFTIAGWVSGRDGKRLEWWSNGRLRIPAFMVPATALTPFERERPPAFPPRAVQGSTTPMKNHTECTRQT